MGMRQRVGREWREGRRSVVWRTLAGLFATAILLIAVASVSLYWRDSARNADVIERTLDDRTTALSATLAGWFEGRILLVRLANDMMAQGGDRAGREVLIRNDTVNGSFEEVFFGEDSSGEMARSGFTRQLPPGFDVRTRPWYVAAIAKRRAVITDPYLSAGDRGIVTTIAVPLYRAGRLIGVTGSDFRLSTIIGLLGGQRDDGQAESFIVDADGKIIVHPDGRLVGTLLRRQFEGPLDPADARMQSALHGGRGALVMFRPLRGVPSLRPWYVATTIDTAVAAAPLRAMFLRSAGMAVILVVTMLAGFLAILATGVLRPLKALTESIDGIASGNFDAAVPHIDREDEIGEVARAVAIFRDNGREVKRLREQESRRVEADAAIRAAMMNELQAAFGEVVDAASRGDLERQVTADFRDGKLNALAASVNLLIATMRRGLNEAGEVLSAIARTDLTRRVEGRYSGAFDAIRRDTNGVADRLSEVVGQLQNTSEQLRAGIGDLTCGAHRLRLRADEQTAAVRGTSDEIQLIGAIVLRHSYDAEAASLEGRQAREVGERGGEAMRAASVAMRRMTDASDRVLGVADLLDDIATQTSLVALNAAIEAQRAGLSGRTFAVVAEEVRRLANHATTASKEVKAMIGAASGEVAEGVRLVGKVEVELMAMLEALARNSALVDAMAESSRQQARSVGAIETSVAQFDAAVRDNLALVTDLGRFTADAERRAAELDAIVERFTLAPPLRLAS